MISDETLAAYLEGTISGIGAGIIETAASITPSLQETIEICSDVIDMADVLEIQELREESEITDKPEGNNLR